MIVLQQVVRCRQHFLVACMLAWVNKDGHILFLHTCKDMSIKRRHLRLSDQALATAVMFVAANLYSSVIFFSHACHLHADSAACKQIELAST
jgi:hypothetical protein